MRKKNQASSTPAPENTNSSTPRKRKITVKVAILIIAALLALSVASLAVLGHYGIQIGPSLFNQGAQDEATSEEEDLTDDDEIDADFTVDTKLDEDFPSEVPIFEPSELSGTTHIDGERREWIASYTTDSPARAVYDYYESTLGENGWALEATHEAEDTNIVNAYHESSDIEIMVSINPDTENNVTDFTLTAIQ